MVWAALVLVIVLHFASSSGPSPYPCPCADERDCDTIRGPPVRNSELFGFYGSWVHETNLPPGQDLNFTHLTTVAWASQDDVMCLAHRHGARAVLASPPIDLHALADGAKRAAWVEDALDQVRRGHRDGIVFDHEDPHRAGSQDGRTYVALVSETRDAFHAADPSLQVSTCVPWSPDSIDGRTYPFVALADASDLIYVMDYDTRSQIFAQCIAGPNAPFPGMVRGVERYLDLGIPPSKLVLGVPWYGYRYPCLPGTAPGATYCPTKQVPFRGVNCSDAAGNEVAYASLMRTLRGASGGTGGLRRDGSTGDPFFNSLEPNDTNRTSTVYQYWFDDPQSLRAKYAWARSKEMLGVGPYVLNNLDPIHAANDAVEMWTAFDTFFKSEKGEKIATISMGSRAIEIAT